MNRGTWSFSGSVLLSFLPAPHSVYAALGSLPRPLTASPLQGEQVGDVSLQGADRTSSPPGGQLQGLSHKPVCWPYKDSVLFRLLTPGSKLVESVEKQAQGHNGRDCLGDGSEHLEEMAAREPGRAPMRAGRMDRADQHEVAPSTPSRS